MSIKEAARRALARHVAPPSSAAATVTVPAHAEASDFGDWEERAAICEHDGELTRAEAEALATHCHGSREASEGTRLAFWREKVADLAWLPCPRCAEPTWWGRLPSVATAFLDTWGTTAEALGWTDHDLFGVHISAPQARFDSMGLVPLLTGAEGRVVAVLTAEVAVIETRGKQSRFFRRLDGKSPVGTVLVWEISNEERT